MSNTKGGSQYAKNGKTHYQRFKNYYLDKNKIVRKRNQDYISNIKKLSKCVDCGYSGEKHPEVIDFDHKPGSNKKAHVSEAVRNLWSIKKIDIEIAKCDTRCANCHRIMTKKRIKGL